jgi:hypothetical protein
VTARVKLSRSPSYTGSASAAKVRRVFMISRPLGSLSTTAIQ